MSELNKQPDIEQAAADAQAPVQSSVASASRRRLIKLGTAAVPVVATLTSRPAMAWHCKSPSAWGSNPTLNDSELTKSQQANKAHDTVVDEVWTVQNWANNSTRANLGNPWDVVKTKCGISSSKPFADIKFKHLSSLGIYWPAGVSGEDKVCTVLNNGGAGNNPPTYTKAVIVAGLNYALLGNSRGLAKCMMPIDLQEMASGSVQISKTVSWGPTEIRDYLYNNYVARGS